MDGVEFARIIETELANRGIKKGEFYNATGISATAMYGWKRGSLRSIVDISLVSSYVCGKVRRNHRRLGRMLLADL